MVNRSGEDALREVGRRIDGLELTCAENIAAIVETVDRQARSLFTDAEREIVHAAEAQINASIRVLRAVHGAATRRLGR